ncbi:hypothetical protein ACOSP7_010196 [Xanthoceras sorbifolium]
MAISGIRLNWTLPGLPCEMQHKGPQWCLIDCSSVWSHVEANRRGDERGWIERTERVTSTGVIDLDSNGGPSTFVVDDIPERVVISERSKNLGKETETLTSGVGCCGFSTSLQAS